jgi:protein gp37
MMGDDTGIQWTDATWNPVTGCAKVSPGCAHCYAETVADRFWATQYPPVQYTTCSGAAGCTHEDGTCAPFIESRPRIFTDVQCHADRLMQPLRWRRPRRIFVNSMSDLFHESVPDQFITDVFGVMALAHWHTFQVLTKRPERMRDYMLAHDHGIIGQFRQIQAGGGIGPREMFAALDMKRRDGVGWTWPLPNVWLGTSVENQRFADQRIPLLLQTPAAVRFVSAEPLLGPIVFAKRHLGQGSDCPGCGWMVSVDEDGCCATCGRDAMWYGLDWVIVGGESGPGARPFDIEWARRIIRQCRRAGVPVFVKQLGQEVWWDGIGPCPADYIHLEPHLMDGRVGWRLDLLRDRKGGDPSEWPEDLRVREYPTAA